MRKISEVCKITGVTRRTLQEYNEYKLLSPTDTTESGYWLYDDEAIHKLMFIQTLRAAKYKRREIKDILDNPEERLTSDLISDAIYKLEKEKDRLEEEKKKVEEMIEVLRFNNELAPNLPEDFFEIMAISDPALFFGDGMSYEDANKKLGSMLLDWSDEDKSSVIFMIRLAAELFIIGSMLWEKSAEEIIIHIGDFYHSLVDSICDDSDDRNSEIEKMRVTIEVLEYMSEMAESSGITEKLNSRYGDEASYFIAHFIKNYGEMMKALIEELEEEKG